MNQRNNVQCLKYKKDTPLKIYIMQGGIKMDSKQKDYNVEYQCPKRVVYYRKVQASDIEEAKQQILAQQPDMKIRAVNLIDSD